MRKAAARAVAAAAAAATAAAAPAASSSSAAAAAAKAAEATAAGRASAAAISSTPLAIALRAAAPRRFLATGSSGGGGGSAQVPPNSSSNAPKSMLDMSFAHPGAAGEVLGSAAEARLQTLQASSEGAASASADAAAAAAAGAGAAAAGAAPMGSLRRAFSLATDAGIVAGLFAVAAGGYLYARHPLAEVEAMLANARERAGYAAEERRRAAELEAEAAAAAAALAAAAAAAAEEEAAARRKASGKGGLFGKLGGGGGDAAQKKNKQPQQQQQQEHAAASAPAAAARFTPADGPAAAPPPSSLVAAAQAWLLERYLSLARPLDAKVREYADPPCDALLPDLPPEHRGRVKTLVVDLEGVLTHKTWSRGRGWTVYKRPGASEFLQAAAQYYEVVVYTSEPNLYADPVINRLDPERTAVAYRLYRQDTQYTPSTGEHVRDLSKLNRDLSQVLLLACDASAWAFQPDNALKLRPWRGPEEEAAAGGEGGGGEQAAAADADAAAAQQSRRSRARKPDTTLLDLIPFLQMVATKGVADVRDVVRAYDGEPDVAGAFRKRMARLAARKQGQAAAATAGAGH